MSGYNVFPDLEAVVAFTLRDAGIPDLAGVHSSIPGKNPVYPLIIVQRLGGTAAVRQYLDRGRIQLDVWGGAPGDGPGAPTKSVIHDIAQRARVVLHELEGQTVHEPVDAFISGIEDATGPMWLPDPTSGRDRYSLSVWVYGRAVAPIS